MTVGMLRLGAMVLAACAMEAQENARNILDRFPEAEEKEQVTSTCSACHTLTRVAANHRDQAQWAQTVKVHEGRGLKLDPDDAAPIVRYLAAYFGPVVNVNTAAAAEMAELPGVGKKIADAVVQYRERHGPFQSVDGLTAVEGFQLEVLAKVRNRLSTGQEDSAKK